MIKITLPGEPISKDRPRFSKHGTYDLQKPQKHAAKFQILEQVRKYPSIPFPGHVAIEIEMHFYFAIPKGKENLYHWGLLDNVQKPDTDNILKFYWDVLTGIIYDDDKQVNIAHATKQYSENPRTEILIVPKKPECSDQIKDLLTIVSPAYLSELSEQLSNIADLCTKSENPYHINDNAYIDFEEIAYLIIEFAQRHADSLKKINKKFPGLAKVLEEKLKEK